MREKQGFGGLKQGFGFIDLRLLEIGLREFCLPFRFLFLSQGAVALRLRFFIRSEQPIAKPAAHRQRHRHQRRRDVQPETAPLLSGFGFGAVEKRLFLRRQRDVRFERLERLQRAPFEQNASRLIGFIRAVNQF